MQKNDKSYTFLLSHKSKSKIYIRRIELSKRFLHLTAFGTFLLLSTSAMGFGVNALINSPVFHNTSSQNPLKAEISAIPTQKNDAVDYSRPPASAELALNSGGPEADIETDGENSELENQLNVLRVNANPAFLPTMWAHLGKINNEFGFRRNPFGGRSYEFHPGMDIDGERGDLVIAPADGTVTKAGWTGGYGNMVEIDHGGGLTTRYGHMSKIEAKVGESITRGQLIGYIGSTGRSTGPHLHYELRLNDKPINPRHFLPPEPTDLAAIQ